MQNVHLFHLKHYNILNYSKKRENTQCSFSGHRLFFWNFHIVYQCYYTTFYFYFFLYIIKLNYNRFLGRYKSRKMEGEKMSPFKLFFLIILLLFLGGCSNYEEKTIEYVLENEDFTNIEEIVIRDGSTGDTKTVTDKAQIAKILSLINDVVLYKDDNQEPRDGFLYTLTFKEDSKKLSISDKMIHDTYYTTKPNLAHIIKTFYEQFE